MRDAGGMPAYEMPVAHGVGGGRTGREPWMMNAAQNLVRTFFVLEATPVKPSNGD